jgi:hypothetical protein
MFGVTRLLAPEPSVGAVGSECMPRLSGRILPRIAHNN